MTKKRIGILNKGKNNQFIGNHFNGYDIGIKDEGENTLAKDNKFFVADQNKNKSWWVKILGFFSYLLGKFFG